MYKITAELIIQAYAQGVFPMADTAASADLYWVDPKMRGIIPLDHFHLSKKLAKRIKKKDFEVRVNTSFLAVIKGCAAPAPHETRAETWINDEITALYGELFDQGIVHTIECWQHNKLVGGLYGLSLGGAFCGESMFHTVTDASKVALAYLVARLKVGNYCLLDTQFITSHLAQFGAIEIPRKAYKDRLNKALDREADFYSLPFNATPETILQSLTQTS